VGHLSPADHKRHPVIVSWGLKRFSSPPPDPASPQWDDSGGSATASNHIHEVYERVRGASGINLSG
jgi:hypothetical protein